MTIKLDDKYSRKNLIIMYSVLAGVFGLLCSKASFFATPFAAAYFAALIAFSFPKKHGVLIYALISAAVCSIMPFFGTMQLFSAVLAITIGLSIGLAYVFGRSKPEAVAVTVFVTVILTALFIYLIGAFAAESYEFESVRATFAGLYADIKKAAVTGIREIAVSGGNLNENEIAERVLQFETNFENLVLLLPALLAMIVFAGVGIAFKIFTLSVYKYSKDKSYVLSWRFTTTNLFLIFYIALWIINIFTKEINVFTLSVANLYSIFNLVYAYVGFNFITAVLAQNMSTRYARLVLVFAILLFSSFAAQILAIAGVVFTFAANKARKNFTPPNSGEKNESENDNEK